MSSELYSVREASKRCNVPYRTVYRWIQNDLLVVRCNPIRVTVKQVQDAVIAARKRRSDVQREAQNRGKL